MVTINTKIVGEYEKCGIVNNKFSLCNQQTFCSNGTCKQVVETKKDINMRLCSDTVPLNRTWTLDDIHYVTDIGWVSDKHNCFNNKIKCESNVFNDKLSYVSQNEAGAIKPQLRCWVDRHDEASNVHRHYL